MGGGEVEVDKGVGGEGLGEGGGCRGGVNSLLIISSVTCSGCDRD